MSTTSSANPFAEVPVTPGEHFKLHLYGCVVRLLAETFRWAGSPQSAIEKFSFLIDYNDECAAFGLGGISYDAAGGLWDGWVRAWEAQADACLPLCAVQDELLSDESALRLLMFLGLVEEDARFGLLFEALQGIPGQQRPTLGYLMSAWQGADACGHVRASCRLLQELGFVQVVNQELPRPQWTFRTVPLLWDALRGEMAERSTPWLRYRQAAQFASLDDLILPDGLRPTLSRLCATLSSDEEPVVILRGPQANGRRTLFGAVAKELGYGLLEVHGVTKPDDERWIGVAALATVLRAMPVLVYDAGPGEVVDLPSHLGCKKPVGIVMGKWGGIRGAPASRALTLTVPMPDPSLRRLHWDRADRQAFADVVDQVSGQYRLTGGHIQRTAERAWAYAQLDGRSRVTLSDVQQASRVVNRQILETLATPVEAVGEWDELVLQAHTSEELQMLELRCRERERLREEVGDALGRQLNVGVRALFSGPSGCGKSLAANILAAALGKDLFRVDLSSVVNKYIGETEKNLNQLFTRAEELDVILLLDEGEALMAQRTDVHNANDRYANFETNYLLQRVECFEGILIVTTNAPEHVDRAFQRRMDVVVEFHAPDRMERLGLWQLHLPSDHRVSELLLLELAHRCQLSGGQIRNAVLHASLLALRDASPVTSTHVETAVLREYRKSGQVCPLRRESAGLLVKG